MYVAPAKTARRRRNLGSYRRALRGYRTLGSASSLWSGITQNSLNPFVFLPADWNYIVGDVTGEEPAFLSVPGSEVASSAAYGTPTAGMYGQIKAVGDAAITQAADGNAALAQQQQQLMAQNITAIQNSTGGVAPSIADVFQPGSLLSNLTDPSSVEFWAVLGAGALAVYLVLKLK